MPVFKCRMCGAKISHVKDQEVVTCPYCGVSQTIHEEKAKEIDFFELEKQKERHAQYLKYAELLSKGDSYPYHPNQLRPAIMFFEKNITYGDSKELLLRAKPRFIRAVTNLDECAEAEKYLRELSSQMDTKDLREFLTAKKKELRERWMRKEKLLFDLYCVDCRSFVLTVGSLINSRDALLANGNALSSQETSQIKARQQEVIDSIERNYPQFVEEASNLRILSVVRTAVQSYNESGIGHLPEELLDLRQRTLEEQQKREARRRKIRMAIIVTASVLAIGTVIGLIAGAIASSRYNHSPKAFSFEVLNKTTEYHPDESPYVNGCYYIYFDYQIDSASKVGVDYMTFDTEVMKNGTKLGTIQTSLENMNLEGKGSKVYKIYLQENQPERNAFFTQLYNAEFFTLSFSFTVNTISFADGRYYFGPNHY